MPLEGTLLPVNVQNGSWQPRRRSVFSRLASPRLPSRASRNARDLRVAKNGNADFVFLQQTAPKVPCSPIQEPLHRFELHFGRVGRFSHPLNAARFCQPYQRSRITVGAQAQEISFQDGAAWVGKRSPFPCKGVRTWAPVVKVAPFAHGFHVDERSWTLAFPRFHLHLGIGTFSRWIAQPLHLGAGGRSEQVNYPRFGSSTSPFRGA